MLRLKIWDDIIQIKDKHIFIVNKDETERLTLYDERVQMDIVDPVMIKTILYENFCTDAYIIKYKCRDLAPGIYARLIKKYSEEFPELYTVLPEELQTIIKKPKEPNIFHQWKEEKNDWAY